jgi:hypothetical protein
MINWDDVNKYVMGEFEEKAVKRCFKEYVEKEELFFKNLPDDELDNYYKAFEVSWIISHVIVDDD